MYLRFLGYIVFWLALWILSWRVFYGPLSRSNINYVDRFGVTSAYFLLLSVLVIFLFRERLSPLTKDFTALPFVVLAFVSLLQVLVYHLSRRYLKRPTELIEKNPYEFFLRLDYRYLVSKAFEILYQQTMIVVLILIINGTINNLAGVMIVYAVVFGLGHFPMIGLFGEQQKSFTRFYVVVAVGSAIVFPVLILRVNYGFVYSYVVHSIFYTFLAGWFWVRGTLGGAQ